MACPGQERLGSRCPGRHIAPGQQAVSNVTLSADGTRLAFSSRGANLTGHHPDGTYEFFLYDLDAGTYTPRRRCKTRWRWRATERRQAGLASRQEGRDHRADDEAGGAEQREAAQGGNEDHQAESSPDPERRQAGDDLASLLTPVVKAFQTDLGFEMTNVALQVCGGYGYTSDYGIEQLVRDARITPIYEGTNGIQALDLVGRKLPAHTGRYLRRFFHPVAEFLQAEAGNPEMEEFVAPAAKAFERLQRATAWLAQEGMKNPDQAGAGAVEYLHLFGYTALGYLWARMAKVALAKRGGEDAAFYDAKLRTARFYMQRLLPRSGSLFASLMAGSETMMAFPDAAF